MIFRNAMRLPVLHVWLLLVWASPNLASVRRSHWSSLVRPSPRQRRVLTARATSGATSDATSGATNGANFHNKHSISNSAAHICNRLCGDPTRIYSGFRSPRRDYCKRVSKVFTSDDFRLGYNLLDTVPAEICSMNVTERAPSKNYLALRTNSETSRRYILNGNYAIQWSGGYPALKSVFLYRRDQANIGETISARGPLEEDIQLMLIYQGRNPGISLEYLVPVLATYSSGQAGQSRGQASQRRDELVRGNPDRGHVVGGKGHQTQDTRTHHSRNPDPPARRQRPHHPAPSPQPSLQHSRPANHPLRNPSNISSSINSYNPFRNPSNDPSNLPRSPSRPYYHHNRNVPSIRKSNDNFKQQQNPVSTSVPQPAIQPMIQTTTSPTTSVTSTTTMTNSPVVTHKLQVGNYRWNEYYNRRETKDQPTNPRFNTGSQQRRSHPNLAPRTNEQFPRSRQQSDRFTSQPEPTTTQTTVGSIPRKEQTGRSPSFAYPPETPLRATGSEDDASRGIGDSGNPDSRKADSSIRNSRTKQEDIIYSWKMHGTTACTQTCGGGSQSTKFRCLRSNDLTLVADAFCNVTKKPPSQTIACNTEACPPDWKLGGWEECSSSCGEGVARRSVSCRRQISLEVDAQVEEKLCQTPKPRDTKKCGRGACTKWHEGPWGNCSVACGKGAQSRSVVCALPGGVTVDMSQCRNLRRPGSTQTCDMGSCIDDKWFTTKWSERCVGLCGHGFHYRQVFCPLHAKSRSNTSVPSNSVLPVEGEQTCDGTMPKSKKMCPQSEQPECVGQWFAGPWEKCSATCGPGTRKRPVSCLRLVGASSRFTVVDDASCNGQEKPKTEEQCVGEDKDCAFNKGTWFMTEWTQCTKSCDTGYRVREVKCLDSSQRASSECHAPDEPATRESCNAFECAEDEIERTRGGRGAKGKDIKCKDKFANCHLVVQARLCSYGYYKKNCCKSCRGYGRQQRKRRKRKIRHSHSQPRHRKKESNEKSTKY